MILTVISRNCDDIIIHNCFIFVNNIIAVQLYLVSLFIFLKDDTIKQHYCHFKKPKDVIDLQMYNKRTN